MSTIRTSATYPITAAPAWRRIAAYMIDYCVFMVPLLGLLTLCSLAFWTVSPFTDNAWLNQGIVILVLTIPVMLYFACCESSRFQATVGKRLMSVSVVDTSGVRATFKQTAVRTMVKFLPWEYFHAMMWHWEGWPTNPAPPTSAQYILMIMGWLVMGWFVVSLFVGSRRAPYDRLAGTIVCKASTTPTTTAGDADNTELSA
jgi:uncharacterized RDD family membrane protein YckC